MKQSRQYFHMALNYPNLWSHKNLRPQISPDEILADAAWISELTKIQYVEFLS